MRRTKHWALAVALALFTILAAAVWAAEDQPVVLTGEINEIYQLVTEDGQVYEIGINDVGNDLVDSHINAKVRVRGTISTAEDGARVITVETFEVIAE
jgi:ABC-type microcin C transport system permease subunit YejE